MDVLRVLVLILCSVGFGAAQYKGRTTPIHFNCTNNPNTCVNPVCSYTKLDTDRVNVTFGCTFLKQMRKITLRYREYNLRQNSNWKASGVDFSVDVCQLTQGTFNPLFKIFMPGVMDTLSKFIHPCPYEGTFLAVNVTSQTYHFMQVLPKGTLIKSQVMLSDIKYMNFATLYMYNEVL